MPQSRGVARVELLSFVVLLLLGLSCGAAWSWRNTGKPQSSAERIDAANLTLPSPAFDPADVVRMQLEALSRFRDDPHAVAQCYSFASPANRRVTGPMTRFARMVLSGAYRPLVFQEQSLVGIPNVKGDRAVVLASVIDAERHLSIYCFYLSKQANDAHRDCWMTDSVLPVPPMEEPPSKGDAEPQPESV